MEKKNLENKASDKLPKEIKPVSEVQNLNKHESLEQMEKDLNAKILKITMRIKEYYPELSQFLEEMPVTLPTKNDPEISLNHLKTYYESLNSLLNKYKVDYPKIEE